MFFNELSCKTMSFKWNNLLVMEFYFFETQIWYAWPKLLKNWILIMQDKKMSIILYIIQNSFEWQNGGGTI